MPAWPPHTDMLWSARPSGPAKSTAFPHGGQSWERRTKAGWRELLPERRLFLSEEEWDLFPPLPHCPNSGGGRSGRTLVVPNCCCHIWQQTQEICKDFFSRKKKNVTANSPFNRKKLCKMIYHFFNFQFKCVNQLNNEAGFVREIHRRPNKRCVKLWWKQHTLATGAGYCDLCVCMCFLCRDVFLCLCVAGRRLMRYECILPSSMVFLGVTVKVNLCTREWVHGWWRQGHVSPTRPIWFRGLRSTLHLLFLPNLCTWG